MSNKVFFKRRYSCLILVPISTFFKNAFGQVLIFDLLLLKAVTWDTRLATTPFLILTLFAFFCFFLGVMILFFCFVGDMFLQV